jgi:hypothetical protein
MNKHTSLFFPDYYKRQKNVFRHCRQNVTGISLDVRSSFSDDDDEEELFSVTPFVDPATLSAPSKPNTTQLSPDSVMIRLILEPVSLYSLNYLLKGGGLISQLIRGCIFSHVRPFYEQAVSDLDP